MRREPLVLHRKYMGKDDSEWVWWFEYKGEKYTLIRKQRGWGVHLWIEGEHIEKIPVVAYKTLTELRRNALNDIDFVEGLTN